MRPEVRSGRLKQLKEADEIDVEVYVEPLTRKNYSLLISALAKSKGMDQFIGIFARYALVRSAPMAWEVIRLLGRKPEAVLAWCKGSVVGGFTVSETGKIENGCITHSYAVKRACLRELLGELERLQLTRGVLSTWTHLPALVRTLKRRGFQITGREKYIVTIPAGWLRLSWTMQRPPGHGFYGLFKTRALRELRFQAPEVRSYGTEGCT